MRPDIDGAPIVMVKVSHCAQTKDPEVADAQFVGPLRVQLQAEAPVGGGMAIHAEGSGEEGTGPQWESPTSPMKDISHGQDMLSSTTEEAAAR